MGDRSLSTNLIHRTRAVKGLEVIWRTSNERDSKELFVGEHMLMDNLLKGADTDLCPVDWCLFQRECITYFDLVS